MVARSHDGVAFERLCEVYRDDFGAESFERPVIVRRPEGGWRLYVLSDDNFSARQRTLLLAFDWAP